MRWLIIGDGIQGKKRKERLGNSCVGIFDPFTKTADFFNTQDVPDFDIAAICTPNSYKLEYLDLFLQMGKHCLIEKPLHTLGREHVQRIELFAKKNNLAVYVAFNHRFEPSIRKLKEILNQGRLGKTYFIYMKYGNGTVQDILKSPWKGYEFGLIDDLGSHVFDIYNFLFNTLPKNLRVEQILNFESRYPDYARIAGDKCFFELSYVNWKSEFVIEIVCSGGAIKLHGLPKWGKSTLELHTRVFPSGIPSIETVNFSPPDETWIEEHRYLEELIHHAKFGLAAKEIQLTELFEELYRL